jgi:hypothetical protein
MMKNFRFSKFWLSFTAVFMLTLGWAVHSYAQSAGTAEIRGTITDQTGALVPGASIIVRSLDTGAERNLTSNEAGIYLAPLLQPGQYEVIATKEGLAQVKRENIVLEVGQTLAVDVSLPLRAEQATITVTGQGELVDTQKSDISETISQTYIDNLPLNGRRWSNFVLLTPGVSEDGGFGGISFRGISSLYNNNTVDGADNNQAFFSEARGRTRMPYQYSLDAIKEFNVITAAYTAEFGRAAGGVVNAVTRSGGNEIHGDAFYFIRDAAFLAQDPLAKSQALSQGLVPVKPAERRQQFGAGIGGPLAKDKLFYFLDYDQQKRNFPAVVTPFTPGFFSGPEITSCVDPNCPTVIAALQALTNTTDPRNGDNYVGLAKLDYQINSSHHLSNALNIVRWNSLNGIFASPTTSTTALGNGTDNVANEFNVTTWSWIINPRMVNEARFQYGRDFESEAPNASGPAFIVSGAASFGMPNFLPRAKYPDEKRFEWADNMSWARGRHQIKFGLDINYVREDLINLFQGGGEFDYFNDNGTTDALNNFATDLRTGSRSYTFFNQAGDPINGSGGGFFTTTDHNFYVQDNVQVRPNLALNLGVRYELQTMPSVVKAFPSVPETAKLNTDKNNFGPRVGFSWGIGGGQKLVVRGGYGIYYGRTSNSAIFTALFQNGVFQQSFFFLPFFCGAPAAPNIVFPQALGAPNFTPVFGSSGPTPTNKFSSVNAFLTACPSASGSAVVTALDSHFVNPLVHQFDLAFEGELPGRIGFTVSYIGSRGEHLPTFVDANLPPPDTTASYQFTDYSGNTSLQTLPFFSGAAPRPNPNAGVILMGKSAINSWYHALVVQLRRRTAHGFTFDMNFTWAQARDNGQPAGVNGTFAGTDEPINPFNLKSDYGLSDLDVRRRFIFTTYWEMPFGNWTQNEMLKRVVEGWNLSSVWRVQDGQPVTALMDSSPSCATNDGGLTCGLVSGFGSSDVGRVPFIERNSLFTMPYIFTTDLRAGRQFKINDRTSVEFLWEAFNLFNRTNVFGVDNDAFFLNSSTGAAGNCPVPSGATNFQGCVVPRVPRTAFLTANATSNDLYGARQMQFGLRLRF